MRFFSYSILLAALASLVVWTTHRLHQPPVLSSALSASSSNSSSTPSSTPTAKSTSKEDLIVIEELMFRANDSETGPSGQRSLPHYWATESLSGNQHNATNPMARTTLRYDANVNLDLPEFELWALYIPDVLHDVAVTLNGNPIGPPLQAPLFSRAGLRSKYIPLPGGALESGINHFTLTLTAQPAQKAVLGKLYIGPARVLQPLQDARALQHQLLWFTAIALCLIGLISIVLGRSANHDPVYNWFGAMCLAWLIAMSSQLLTHSPVDWRWIELAGSLARISFICISYLFCLSFIGQAGPTISRVIVAVGTITAATYIANALFEFSGQLHLQLTIGALQSIGLFVAYRFTRRAIVNPSDDIFSLALAGALILGFGVHDTYMGFTSDAPTVRYLNYLTPILFIVAGYVLLRRFSRALRKVELQAATPVMPAQALSSNTTGARRILVAERERIMRDMHDGVGGHLVSSLSILRNHKISDPDLEEALSQALVDLRLMIDSLEETDGDLSVAVAMLKDRTQRALKGSDTTTSWRIDEIVLPQRGPADTLQILRIIQESISNVLKHANADQLAVSAKMAGAELAHFCIHDNGSGFDVDATRDGRGLMNLRRRAVSIGARLEIDSNTSGTRIDLWVPNTAYETNPTMGAPS